MTSTLQWIQVIFYDSSSNPSLLRITDSHSLQCGKEATESTQSFELFCFVFTKDRCIVRGLGGGAALWLVRGGFVPHFLFIRLHGWKQQHLLHTAVGQSMIMKQYAQHRHGNCPFSAFNFKSKKNLTDTPPPLSPLKPNKQTLKTKQQDENQNENRKTNTHTHTHTKLYVKKATTTTKKTTKQAD